MGILILLYVLRGLGVQLARARFTQIGLAPVGLGQLRRQGPLGAILALKVRVFLPNTYFKHEVNNAELKDI